MRTRWSECEHRDRACSGGNRVCSSGDAGSVSARRRGERRERTRAAPPPTTAAAPASRPALRRAPRSIRAGDIICPTNHVVGVTRLPGSSGPKSCPILATPTHARPTPARNSQFMHSRPQASGRHPGERVSQPVPPPPLEERLQGRRMPKKEERGRKPKTEEKRYDKTQGEGKNPTTQVPKHARDSQNVLDLTMTSGERDSHDLCARTGWATAVVTDTRAGDLSGSRTWVRARPSDFPARRLAARRARLGEAPPRAGRGATPRGTREQSAEGPVRGRGCPHPTTGHRAYPPGRPAGVLRCR